MIHREADISQQQEAARLADELLRLDGTPEQFLASLAEVQRRLADSESGAILRLGSDGVAHVLALSPTPASGDPGPAWLADAGECAKRAVSESRAVVVSLFENDELYGQEPSRHLIVVPLGAQESLHIVGAFVVRTRNKDDLNRRRERLEITRGLLSLYEMRSALQKNSDDGGRLRMSLEIMSAVSAQSRAKAACMAICNEAGGRLGCERVSVGFLKGRVIQLAAMSHTEKIIRKMRLVQELESVMEECFDQDVEVLVPAPEDAPGVNRVAKEFARENGPAAVCSLPLRVGGDPVGVLTLERPEDRPFVRAEVESLRLACDQVAPRLVELRDHDRWLGARMARVTRNGLAVLLGPERVWIKLTALLVLGAAIFLTFVKGTYRVEADFAFEAMQRQIAPAPFDGYLHSVFVEPGDPVEAGVTVLATLDSSELRLRLAAAMAEESRYRTEASIARRDREIARAQIAEAGAAEARANIDLLTHQIEQATITSRIGGVVVGGDLRRQIGSPVQKGSVLFEIAPIDSLRAELAVPEDQIADVEVGQTGHLAASSYPSDRIRFEVERINPVAEVADQKNVFAVRVRLEESRPWMRPGMEGVAKIDVDRRPYGWIWTRRVVNWVRMQLWI
ncbi:MAG: HlyD family efflux transporter periplasmic adaptor subunit [Phycisphaeraceae bacterium]|nr:MAG: HlyD family efflux transporter periplasmic adaptor subunit [Phycisphaeraceae bacterium]